MSTELTKLMKQWQDQTDGPMPEWIRRLPMHKIKEAFLRVCDGQTLVNPVAQVASTAKLDPNESMMEWDSRGFN